MLKCRHYSKLFKLAGLGPQNDRRSLEMGLLLGYWALPSTFSKQFFWSERSFYGKVDNGKRNKKEKKEEKKKNGIFSGHFAIASSLPSERLRPNDDRWNAARSCQDLQIVVERGNQVPRKNLVFQKVFLALRYLQSWSAKHFGNFCPNYMFSIGLIIFLGHTYDFLCWKTLKGNIGGEL